MPLLSFFTFYFLWLLRFFSSLLSILHAKKSGERTNNKNDYFIRMHGTKKYYFAFFPTSSSIVCGLMGNVHVTLVHDEVNGR